MLIPKDIVCFEADWINLDQSVMEERKNEWEYIKQNLKSMARCMDFGCGYLPAHKKFYFEGVLTDEIGSPWSLFFLWYYPELNEKNCREIMMKLVEMNRGDAGILRTIRHDYLQKLRFAQIQYPTEYGMMGEREKIVVRELIGEVGKGAFFDQPGFEKELGFGAAVLGKRLFTTAGVLMGKPGFKYEGSQYLWPHASYFIEQRKINDGFGKSDKLITTQLIDVINMIVNFASHSKTAKDDAYAVQAKDRIMSQYENNEIYGHLRFLFDEVIKDGGKSLKLSFRKKLP